MKNSYLVASLLVSFTLALSGCTESPRGKTLSFGEFQSQPDVMAPDDIRDSFSAKKSSENNGDASGARANAAALEKRFGQGDVTLDRMHLVIQRSALEKEFLLQTSLIPQPGAPMSNGQKSRVVAFRERGDRLYLLEATAGHNQTRGLPMNLVLCEFSILKSDEASITFDFNRGMSELYLYGDWHGQDFESPTYDPDAQFESVKLKYSFIESAQVEANNQLVIRQIAQAETAGPTHKNTPVEMRYYLSPYRPSAGYEAFESPGIDRVGFFEVAPQAVANSLGSVVLASRFDPKKPITFALSANTPENYRQAVMDGVLYWNRVFGSEVVKVEVAPEGVVAPDARHNIVQWVDFDAAGFAYADAQMDPRTGEILHAQVYMTSTFATGGRKSAKKLLRRLKSQAQENGGHAALHGFGFALKGFEKPGQCRLTQDQRYIEALEQVLAAGSDDETILKVSQDYVREVVAHEIGHTLGLRHNFAGSLALNYPLSERDAKFKVYLETGKAPEGIVLSSSVMEYQLFQEGAMTGAQMDSTVADKVAPMKYDEVAIATLYQGKEFTESEIPAFCSDSLADEFQDCTRFDIGASPAEEAAYWNQVAPQNFAFSLAESMLAQRVGMGMNGEGHFQVARLTFPALKAAATVLVDGRVQLAQAMDQEQVLFKIHQSFLAVDSTNATEVRLASQRYLASEIERLGGLNTVYGKSLAGIGQEVFAKFSRLIRGYYRSLEVKPGKVIEFTDAELVAVEAAVQKYLAQVEAKAIQMEIDEFAKVTLADQSYGETMAEIYLKRIQEIFHAQGSVPVTADVEVKDDKEQTHLVHLVLPSYTYPAALREKALELVSAERGESPIFGLYERKALKTELEKVRTDLFSEFEEYLAPELMPKEAARWWNTYYKSFTTFDE